jgi:hypothetical protein
MTPYSLVKIYLSFRGKYLSPLEICSGDRDHFSEIPVNFCQTLVFLVPTWITTTIYNSINKHVACLRGARFWAITQRVVVVSYQSFGATYCPPSLRVKNPRSNLFSRERTDTLQMNHAVNVLRHTSHYLVSYEILRIFRGIFGLQTVKKFFR